MPSFRTLSITLLCLFQALSLYAQKNARTKSPYTRDRHNYRAPVVGHTKAKTICPIFENSKYPYQGIGFKIGDPFSLSYKLYPNKYFSFVVDAGKPSSGLYSQLFREEFVLKSDELAPGKESPTYLSHKVENDFVLDIKALYQHDADKLAKGLQLYGGIGWEFRKTTVVSDYLFETGVNENEFDKVTNNRLTQGVQAAMGIEYSYFQLPISAFIEMEYYVDMIQQPGWTHLQGGIGLRYVF